MAKKKNKKVKNTIKGNKLRTLNIYKTKKKADDTTKQKSDANTSKSNSTTTNSQSTNNDKEYKKFVDHIVSNILKIVKLSHENVDTSTIKKVLGNSKLTNAYNEFTDLKYDDNDTEGTLNLLFETMNSNVNKSMNQNRLSLNLNLEESINSEFEIALGIVKMKKLNALIHGNYKFENIITDYLEDDTSNDSQDVVTNNSEEVVTNSSENKITKDTTINTSNNTNYLELLSLLKSKASLILNNNYTIEIIEKFRNSKSFNSLEETERNKCIHSTLYWLFGTVKNSIKYYNKVSTSNADNRLIIEICNHITEDEPDYDISNWIELFDNTINDTITEASNKGFTGDDIWKMLLGIIEFIKNSIIEKFDNPNLPIEFNFDELTTLRKLVTNVLLTNSHFDDTITNNIKNVINTKISKYALVIDHTSMYPSIDTSDVYFSKDLYSDVIIKIIFDNFHNVINTTLTKKDENLKPIYDALYTKTA